jgi:hypothetical protein
VKREWSDDELIEHWTLLPDESRLLTNKTGAPRLGFAALLKSFQQDGRFPRSRQEVPAIAIAYLARSLRYV